MCQAFFAEKILNIWLWEDILMELTEEQDAKFRSFCKEIKPGQYGRVIVSFMGTPSNLVQIIGEKTCRYQQNDRARLPGTIRGRPGGNGLPGNRLAGL
jgi:hypothetical protein